MFILLKKPFLPIIAVLFLLSFCFSVSFAEESVSGKEVEVIDGVLDLEDWDFEEDGVIFLSGDWEFYWEQLLTYSDFQRDEMPEKTGYLRVPGDWNGYLVDGEELKGFGYATYRLVIKNIDEDTIMGIRSAELCTAYSLWLNDEFLAANGVVSANPEDGVPAYNMDVAFFIPESSTVELIMQVSNYHHRRGGLNTGLELGTADQIHDERNRRTNSDLFLFGSLIILAFYNLGYFYYNRKEKAPLYFSLFCIAILLRSAATGEIIIRTVIPNINWQLHVAVEYSAMVIAITMLVLFFQALYPEDVSKSFARFMFWVTSLYTLFVILTPVYIFSHTTMGLLAIAIVPVFYMVWVIVRIGFIKKREGSLLVGIGFIVVALTGIMEAMIYLYIIEIPSVFNYGLIFFVFSQSMVISIRFIKAYLYVETMSQQLKEYGETLESKVRKRTEKLQGILEKLRYVIVNETNSAINMLSTGSQELAGISGDSMERASEMNNSLQEAGKNEQKVSERVTKGLNTIEHLEQETAIAKEASENMEEVSRDMVAILEGIQTFNAEIKGISKQVKLLAINAGIEAARAGARGTSFAVVAEEVKKLSAKIYGFVEKIDNQTEVSNKKLKELRGAVSSVSKGIVRTEETVETTNEVYNEIITAIDELSVNLKTVIASISDVSEDSQNISSISQEQAATTEEIRDQISNLVELVESLEQEE